jgi:hypothetical protein
MDFVHAETMRASCEAGFTPNPLSRMALRPDVPAKTSPINTAELIKEEVFTGINNVFSPTRSWYSHLIAEHSIMT